MRLTLRSPAVAAVLLAAGLLGTAVAVAARSAVTPPPAIKSAGQIVYCSDITYPPEESYQGTKPVGSDIDFGTAIAKQMGVKAVFKNTVFDSIIAALKAKKCDAIISGMNDTPDRRKQVDFVDYLKVGQSVMVKKGNPEHITTLASLSGKKVSVESGTTNRDFLAAESTKLTKAGKKAINIVTFPKDTDAAAALSEIGYLLRKEEKDAYRARAFTRAAAELLTLQPDLAALRTKGALETIPGVGSGIARVLVELVDTGSSRYLIDLRERLGEAPQPGDTEHVYPLEEEDGERGAQVVENRAREEVGVGWQPPVGGARLPGPGRPADPARRNPDPLSRATTGARCRASPRTPAGRRGQRFRSVWRSRWRRSSPPSAEWPRDA